MAHSVGMEDLDLSFGDPATALRSITPSTESAPTPSAPSFEFGAISSSRANQIPHLAHSTFDSPLTTTTTTLNGARPRPDLKDVAASLINGLDDESATTPKRQVTTPDMTKTPRNNHHATPAAVAAAADSPNGLPSNVLLSPGMSIGLLTSMLNRSPTKSPLAHGRGVSDSPAQNGSVGSQEYSRAMREAFAFSTALVNDDAVQDQTLLPDERILSQDGLTTYKDMIEETAAVEPLKEAGLKLVTHLIASGERSEAQATQLREKDQRIRMLATQLVSLHSVFQAQATAEKERWLVETELLKREARALARKLAAQHQQTANAFAQANAKVLKAMPSYTHPDGEARAGLGHTGEEASVFVPLPESEAAEQKGLYSAGWGTSQHSAPTVGQVLETEKQKKLLQADKVYLKKRLHEQEALTHRLEAEIRALRPKLINGAPIVIEQAEARPLAPGERVDAANTFSEDWRKVRAPVMGDAEAEHLILAGKRMAQVKRNIRLVQQAPPDLRSTPTARGRGPRLASESDLDEDEQVYQRTPVRARQKSFGTPKSQRAFGHRPSVSQASIPSGMTDLIQAATALEHEDREAKRRRLAPSQGVSFERGTDSIQWSPGQRPRELGQPAVSPPRSQSAQLDASPQRHQRVFSALDVLADQAAASQQSDHMLMQPDQHNAMTESPVRSQPTASLDFSRFREEPHSMFSQAPSGNNLLGDQFPQRQALKMPQQTMNATRQHFQFPPAPLPTSTSGPTRPPNQIYQTMPAPNAWPGTAANGGMLYQGFPMQPTPMQTAPKLSFNPVPPRPSSGPSASASTSAVPTPPVAVARAQAKASEPGAKRQRSPYVKWNLAEDELLAKAVAQHGQRWDAVSKCVPSRSYHQCRQRWLRGLKSGENLPVELAPWYPIIKESVARYQMQRMSKADRYTPATQMDEEEGDEEEEEEEE
ncbi:uncharacterized protein L969DRAFT_44021 [Mixia osmundae IAM 14324]|uniref:Uncharacterized protein n=1 Tax=Mixia osmundae (strain CBS 9802 / IAM 14324 / JCM 22182 / KY 12970) TaxID=764103 RepID=G7EAF5_MIXOS|nr:uncharacterized protein L969DRAFT_44021 [Mixia osmundae IAM 14324]KEI42305.1 hypothetical protein L969DRAFT_44021 [Mixia osmundae IAM 14324]GAA99815.1 hypothetical protein E5Q_06518 [Mixia osmundae IAM 14324]